MRFLILTAMLSALVCFGSRHVQADTWTNSGKKSVQLESGNYSGTARYVAATAAVVFKVGEFIENDTRTPVEGPKVEENDPQREGRIIRTAGTLAADKWGMIPENGLFGIGQPVIVLFDSKAPEGATVSLAMDVHDKRLGTDPRHDDWVTMKTWTFTVSNACPSGLVTESITQTTPAQIPANTSIGSATVVVKTTGGPPAAPRTNWNGTEIDESFDPDMPPGMVQYDPAKFDARMANLFFVRSSFTIGHQPTATPDYTNKIRDQFVINEPYLVLKAGVSAAPCNLFQIYSCKESKTYSSIVEWSWQRVGTAPNVTCKATIAKAP